MYLALTRDRFLISEFITVCRLKRENLSENEIMERLINENPFQFESVVSIQSIAGTLIKRTRVLDSRKEMLTLTESEDVSDYRSVNLYCMMKNNKLIEDLCLEVVFEKYHFKEELTGGDVTSFLRRLSEQDIRVSSWSNSTTNRTRNELIKILVDTGIVFDKNLGRVSKVRVSSNFYNLLEAYGDYDYQRIFEV